MQKSTSHLARFAMDTRLRGTKVGGEGEVPRMKKSIVGCSSYFVARLILMGSWRQLPPTFPRRAIFLKAPTEQEWYGVPAAHLNAHDYLSGCD